MLASRDEGRHMTLIAMFDMTGEVSYITLFGARAVVLAAMVLPLANHLLVAQHFFRSTNVVLITVAD